MVPEVTKEDFKKEINLVSDTTFKYLLKNKRTRKWIYEIIKDCTSIDLSKFRIVNVNIILYKKWKISVYKKWNNFYGYNLFIQPHFQLLKYL
jgi:hypothetical protein